MPTPHQPPFELTARVVELLVEIMRLVGRYEGLMSPAPQPKLRRQNQIRTVLSTLAIEGNTLSMDQATAILDNKRVIGSKREILEVQNAIGVYASARELEPGSSRALRSAHRSMMTGLIDDAGSYRTKGVGVFQGSKVAHVAPPAKRVPALVEDLLGFVQRSEGPHPLVRAAVAHYEIEFIHPFSDGNGRMGRLWQHVMLVRFHPLFDFVPVESVIHATQAEYYRVLGECEHTGASTLFIEFSLASVLESLEALLDELRPEPMSVKTRLEIARGSFGDREFVRKDYLTLFKALSTATASRDLSDGVSMRTLVKSGEKARTRYRFR